MPINGKYTNQEQLQSMVNVGNGVSDPNQPGILDRLKASIGGAAPAHVGIDGAPLPDAAEPAVDPATAQYQADTGDAHITAMQQANLQDPAKMAKLAEMHNAIQQFQAKQQAAQLGKLQALQPAMPQVGQTYPAQE